MLPPRHRGPQRRSGRGPQDGSGGRRVAGRTAAESRNARKASRTTTDRRPALQARAFGRRTFPRQRRAKAQADLRAQGPVPAPARPGSTVRGADRQDGRTGGTHGVGDPAIRRSEADPAIQRDPVSDPAIRRSGDPAIRRSGASGELLIRLPAAIRTYLRPVAPAQAPKRIAFFRKERRACAIRRSPDTSGDPRIRRACRNCLAATGRTSALVAPLPSLARWLYVRRASLRRARAATRCPASSGMWRSSDCTRSDR